MRRFKWRRLNSRKISGYLNLPDGSVVVSVKLAQLFVGCRLDEPEAGNDTPHQATHYENTHARQESAGKHGNQSNEPDHSQGDVENDVIDADDEVFQGLIPCCLLIGQPLPRGVRMLAQ